MPDIWIYKLFDKLSNLFFQEAISDRFWCVISSGDLLRFYCSQGNRDFSCFLFLKFEVIALPKDLDSKSKLIFSNSSVQKGRKFWVSVDSDWGLNLVAEGQLIIKIMKVKHQRFLSIIFWVLVHFFRGIKQLHYCSKWTLCFTKNTIFRVFFHQKINKKCVGLLSCLHFLFWRVTLKTPSLVRNGALLALKVLVVVPEQAGVGAFAITSCPGSLF